MPATDRPKYLLVQYGTVIAVALALAGVIALWGAWMGAQPMEETERVTIYQEDVATSVGTSAVVTKDTSLYNESEVLREKPVYLFSATPNLTLRVNTTLDATRSAVVSHRLAIHYRAVRNGETFWQRTRTVLNETRATDSGSVSSVETIDVPAIRDTASQFREEIGGAGTFSVAVRLTTTYDVQESPTYGGTLSASAPLVIDSDSYFIDGDLSVSETEQKFATRRMRTGGVSGQDLAFGLIGVLAIAAAVGAVVGQRRLDAEAIRTRIARTRYDEWISRGDIPTDTEKRYVRIDSLEDIVDIGIDSNKRVIWNEEFDIYAVVDGDVVYYYSAGSTELDEWLNL